MLNCVVYGTPALRSSPTTFIGLSGRAPNGAKSNNKRDDRKNADVKEVIKLKKESDDVRVVVLNYDETTNGTLSLEVCVFAAYFLDRDGGDRGQQTTVRSDSVRKNVCTPKAFWLSY